MTPRRASHAKAQQRRARSLAQLNTWSDIQQLAGHTERPPTQPFTLVIEIEAWNIRERGDWGQTKVLGMGHSIIKR